MANYRNILVAVDLNEETNVVVYKASEMASQYDAQLSIVHVVEPLGYAYGGDIPIDMTEVQSQLKGHAATQLQKIGSQFSIPEENQYVVIGRPEAEIHRMVEESGYDLVVVGSHGKHGLQLLFGSTSSGVLHGSNCDVLAVRLTGNS